LASRERIQLSRGARVVLFVVWLGFCVGLAEGAARAGWRLSLGVSLRDPGQILYAYYPEMWHVFSVSPSRDDEFFDVLLLGGSVLDPHWGSIEQQLLEQLFLAGHRNVRVSNVGTPAHTTRDSLHKYRALSRHQFELVMLYHGINETRANNAPPEVFREDYSHYAWYEALNALAPYHGNASLSLPYTFRYLGVRARHALRPDRYIVEHVPREEWTRYGGDVRSAAAFEANLRAIIDEAAARGERLVLSTFAYYVPEDYSQERFDRRELDYVLHQTPLEIWGRPESVVAGIDAHNEVVRRLARDNDGVWFVDQATRMQGTPENFNDAAHLTTAGSRRFVEHILEVLPPTLFSEHVAGVRIVD